MKVKAAFLEGNANTIRTTAEAWAADYSDATDVHVIEELIRTLAASHVAGLEELQANLFRLLFAGELSADAQQTGEILLRLHELAARSFKTLAEAIAESRRRGYDVEGADAFDAANARLTALRDVFRKDWPFPDPVAWENSRRAAAAGRSSTVREILRERRSQRPQTDPG